MFIDWFTVLAQAVNFLVLVALLKRFLYRPILAAIDEREQRIARQIAEAQAAREAAAAERAQFEGKNAQFDSQRAELLEKVNEEAHQQRRSLLDAARRESDALRARLHDALRDEEATLAREIAGRACDAAAAMARRALADLGGQSVEERIVAVFLARLGELPEPERAALARLASPERPLVVRTAFAPSPGSRQAIEQALRQVAGAAREIRFELAPQLIGGIEVAGNGRKLAWNISEYLASLGDEIRQVLAAGAGDERPD